MLNKRTAELHELVWASAAKIGRNAPKIADDIMRRLWPRTYAEAVIEGAEKALRSRLIAAVSRIVRALADSHEQIDFSDIDPSFLALAKELKSGAYTVPSVGEALTVADLIAAPELLEEAAAFMQQKGDECHAEARRLFALHEAVVAAAEDAA